MTLGEIYLMDFGIPFGSEPGYERPVIIAQSNKENLDNLNTTIVIPLTSNTINAECNGNVFISKEKSKLSRDSVALVHQMIVVDKERLLRKLSKIDSSLLPSILDAEDYILKP